MNVNAGAHSRQGEGGSLDSPYFEEEIVRILGGEFSENWGDALAGSAPGGGKVDDDQSITRFGQFPRE